MCKLGNVLWLGNVFWLGIVYKSENVYSDNGWSKNTRSEERRGAILLPAPQTSMPQSFSCGVSDVCTMQDITIKKICNTAKVVTPPIFFDIIAGKKKGHVGRLSFKFLKV